MTLNVEEIRKDFPIYRNNPGLAYLDNAATTQKPQQVINRVSRYYEEQNANVGRGLYDLANEATQVYEGARTRVAKFIGALPSELIFVRNTSEAINLVAHSLELDGDIVVPEMAHHSEQLPWRRKAEKEGLDIKYIPTKDDRLDMEKAKDMIDEDTALVSVAHVSNVFGCENPIEELTELAHDNDAYIMVDAAQSVPRMDIDVKDMDVDFLAFSGHKMLGPTGIGGLYGKKELLEQMEPYQVGGGMIRSVTKEEIKWEEVPQKFEAGTPNIAGAAGLEAAVAYLEEIGTERIEAHEERLSKRMVEGLEELGAKVYSEPGASVVSFTMENAHPHDIAEVLNSEGVAVRAGHHCAQPQMERLEVAGTARASPYIYNDLDDVEQFLKAVEKVQEVFG